MKNPIRVLFLASTADKGGGSLHSLVGLAKQLDREGSVTPFVILPDNGSGEALLREAGLEYKVIRSYGAEWPLGEEKRFRSRLSHFRQRLENLAAIRQISQVVKKKQIQLVHINTSVDEIGYYVARRCRLPFVWYIREFVKESHGIEFYSEKKQLRHISSANSVVTISNSLKERCQNLLPHANIKMIHNGIEFNRFSMPRRVFRDDMLRILSIGRVCDLKGHKDIILAAKKLLLRGMRRFHVLFVGSYGEDYVNFVREEGLADYITFCGFSDDTPKYLSEADVHISASPWETFGRVTVEAMAAGCLAIGVDNAGTKDIICNGETGLLYPVGSYECLSNLIEWCALNAQKREAIAKAGQKAALRQFTIQKCADSVLTVYRDVLSSR